MAPVHFHSPIRTGRRPALVRVASLPQPRITSWQGLLIPVLLTLALVALASTVQAQVAINSTGQPPITPNAMLELSSTDKGMLAPRMTRNQRNAIVTPPNGLLVYQTDDATSEVMGYYYFDATTPNTGWRHIADGGPIWLLGGNAGTTTTDFLGTINNLPLLFWSGNYERGRISADGKLQLYYTAPPVTSEMVHVEGGIKLNDGTTVANTPGTIRYIPGPVNGSVTGPGRFEGNIVNAPNSNLNINGWKQIDNNFGERKNQETADASLGCQDPSQGTYPYTPAMVIAGSRPWPIPGPTTGFGTLSGAASPYWTYWEDSRRQFLYLASDMAAAGICPGPTNPIRAIAFNASSVSGGAGRIHFLRFRMKNTTNTAVTGFDDAGLLEFAQPNPPPSGTPPAYILRGQPGFHTDGFTVASGWNVHFYNEGLSGYAAGTGFNWTGGNLLLDAAIDNQEWTGPSIREANVASYNTSYSSMISSYCDACGSSTTCGWQPGPGFYVPPTTPTNGNPVGTSGNANGWGWASGWSLTNGTNTNTCDGTYGYSGGGTPSISQRLPRVAFLAQYVGGGIAFKIGNYMFADEGLMVGDATWAGTAGAFKGPGTLSAQRSVWSNGSLLNDYVFDLYYDGEAKPEDAPSASRYVRTPLKELPNYVERERRLPTIDGRDQWNKQGTFSVDKLGNQLWITVEDQALYIQELNARMDALKQFLVEKKLKELEGE